MRRATTTTRNHVSSAGCQARRWQCFRRDRVRPVLLAILAAWGMLWGARSSYGQETQILPQRECQVKYAYLYSFGLMVKWPAESFQATRDQFVIGVLGDKLFKADLDRIAQTKTIHNRTIVIRRFATPAEVTPCQILFVTETIGAQTQAKVIKQLEGRPTLLVGETSGFAHSGGVINFFIDGENVRCEINATAAKRQQLTVDPRLIKLAKLVNETPAPRPLGSGTGASNVFDTP